MYNSQPICYESPTIQSACDGNHIRHIYMRLIGAATPFTGEEEGEGKEGDEEREKEGGRGGCRARLRGVESTDTLAARRRRSQITEV